MGSWDKLEWHERPEPEGFHAGFMVLAVGLQSGVLHELWRRDELLSACLLLLKSVNLAERPVVFGELSSADLGETVPSLRPFGQVGLKTDYYDMTRMEGFSLRVPDSASRILVIGAEAHGCVLQTGLGLLRLGKSVIVAADAVGATTPLEKSIALRELVQRGAALTTVEMLLFGLIGSRSAQGSAGILGLVKQHRATRRQYHAPKVAPSKPRLKKDVRAVSDNSASSLGDLLRQARMKIRLTLREVATQSNCSVSQLSKVENDKALPSLVLLQRLGEIYQQDVKSFFAV